MSRGRARWMQNSIPHPTSTHSAYFWLTLLPQKQEMPEKTWWWHHHHVFQVFLIFGVAGSIKSMQCGYSLDVESNSTSNELSRLKFDKTTGRYVENTNTKSSFLILPPKLITIIFLRRHILGLKFPLMELRSYIFLQVGACKSGGCCLLPFISGKLV